jgi:NAD(P)-dependent dehydrogenase (short-subunit alcohol dehydrogenase family)
MTGRWAVKELLGSHRRQDACPVQQCRYRPARLVRGISGEDNDLVVDVNVKGVINGVQACLPLLKETEGRAHRQHGLHRRDGRLTPPCRLFGHEIRRPWI